MFVDMTEEDSSTDEEMASIDLNKRVSDEKVSTKDVNAKLTSTNPQQEDKFYYIASNLKTQLKEPSDFSLLKVFDASKKDVPNSECCQKQLQESPDDKKKTCDEASGGRKDETVTDSDSKVPESSEQPHGWWLKEPLFFKRDDPRFGGAMKFVKYINPDYAKTFSNLRKKIKGIVRNKAQKVKKQENRLLGSKGIASNKRKKLKANKQK